MNEPLSEAQHLIVCLMEEASEVQKACAKALRFGLDDTYRVNNEMGLPKWDLTPRQEIRHELNDLEGVIVLLRRCGVLPTRSMEDGNEASAKAAKVNRMMGYARNEGTLPSPKVEQEQVNG